MATRTALNPLQEAAIVAALVGAASALAWFASTWLSTDSLALIFLLAVTVAGGYVGLRAAIVASVLSFLAYNFFFTEPRFTLAVAHTDDITSLVAFLLVSVIVGQLAGQLREQAAEAQRNAERITTLFEFSRRIATAVDEVDLIEAASRGIGEVLGCGSVVLAARPDGSLQLPVDFEHAGKLDEADWSAARWALANDQPAGHGARDVPGAAWRFEPVTASYHVLGVVGVQAVTGKPALDDEAERLRHALRAQLASAWERLRLQRAAADAHLDQAAAKLRSALLASVSHDLRTPLVSIIGSLSALTDLNTRLSSHDRASLTATALQEAERLNRFVQNLLDMTRLSHGALRPKLEGVSVAEAIQESLRRLDGLLAAPRLEVHVEPSLPPAHADRTLLEQVLVNLLDNAAKYSPAAEPIAVVARRDGGRIVISVTDRGTGIAPEECDKVFDLFYRARQRDAAAAGQGLGLPICRGFVEAMQGRIEARPGPGGRGTTMEVVLPACDKPLARAEGAT